MKEDVLILAIESSCDETAAAVVKNGREVLSNTIYTQIKLHTMFGGVVPSQLQYLFFLYVFLMQFPAQHHQTSYAV